MVAAMAMPMPMPMPALLHQAPGSAGAPCTPLTSLPSFTCSFPRSNRCTVPPVVASRRSRTRRVEAAAGSEAAAPPASVNEDEGPNLPCETCNSKGWLVCDFCKGQKTNVQVRANKFYRRCPSCRAVGVVICPQCKVFKCVSFPDGVDGY